MLFATRSRKHGPVVLHHASLDGETQAIATEGTTSVDEKNEALIEARHGEASASTSCPNNSSAASLLPDTSSSGATVPNNQKQERRRRRRVRFASVQLQEYAVTVGDHPLCKGAFPLTLDWHHSEPKMMTLNDYEARKMIKLQMHLDVRERWERLRLVTGLTENALARLEHKRRLLYNHTTFPSSNRLRQGFAA